MPSGHASAPGRYGNPDLVVAHQCNSVFYICDGVVTVLLGKGDGTFQEPVAYGSGGFVSFSVVVADVNNDGKPDLIASNEYGGVSPGGVPPDPGGVGVLLGNGDGTFHAAVSYASGGCFQWVSLT